MNNPLIALCLGGAQSVWADLTAALDIIGDRPHIIVACNYAGIQFEGHLDAWATLHPERFAAWRAERAARGLNTDYRPIVHSRFRQCPDVEIVPERWSGSSGIYMAQVALEALSASHVILCGAPMDAEGKHIHWPGLWPATATYRPGYIRAKESGASIRSMSGWSRTLFGLPDLEWLNASQAAKVERAASLISRACSSDEDLFMRIKILKTTNFTPPEKRQITLKYFVAGTYKGEAMTGEYTIKRAWGEAMVARGRAVEIPAPRKGSMDAQPQ